LAASVVLALCLGTCAAAKNYTDQPRYETLYGSATRPDETIRVVSFNVKFAEAIAVFRDTPALREPDILALQEMDAPGTERIARALEMNSIFFPAAVHSKTGRDFGNALLSRRGEGEVTASSRRASIRCERPEAGLGAARARVSVALPLAGTRSVTPRAPGRAWPEEPSVNGIVARPRKKLLCMIVKSLILWTLGVQSDLDHFVTGGPSR